VHSTEGTGWFGPEKLTEVIDTYENSQMYLPGKYSKLSRTGSAKPGGCLFRSQNNRITELQDGLLILWEP